MRKVARNRIARLSPFVMAAATMTSCAGVDNSKIVDNPNIIFILADDLGYGEIFYT